MGTPDYITDYAAKHKAPLLRKEPALSKALILMTLCAAVLFVAALLEAF